MALKLSAGKHGWLAQCQLILWLGWVLLSSACYNLSHVGTVEYDWNNVKRDVKPQYKQTNKQTIVFCYSITWVIRNLTKPETWHIRCFRIVPTQFLLLQYVSTLIVTEPALTVNRHCLIAPWIKKSVFHTCLTGLDWLSVCRPGNFGHRAIR